jgi:hypothetical protein
MTLIQEQKEYQTDAKNIKKGWKIPAWQKYFMAMK